MMSSRKIALKRQQSTFDCEEEEQEYLAKLSTLKVFTNIQNSKLSIKFDSESICNIILATVDSVSPIVDEAVAQYSTNSKTT